MGKNGEALRASKMKNVTYTFTREQLARRDEALKQEYQRQYDERLRMQARAEEQRLNDRRLSILPLMMAIPIEVLLDEFHWRPLPEEGKYIHPRSRLARFVLCCEDKLNELTEDETKQSLEDYCRKVWEKSGVRLERTGE